MNSLEKTVIERTQELLASKLGLLIVLKGHFGYDLNTWIEMLRHLQTRDLQSLQAQTVNELLSELLGKGCLTSTLTSGIKCLQAGSKLIEVGRSRRPHSPPNRHGDAE